MTDVGLGEPVSDQAVRPRRGFVERVFAGGMLTFLLFFAIGGAILFFAFKTVHKRDDAQLQQNPASARSHETILYWADHGYLASGGLMSFRNGAAKPGEPQRQFYRSSSGAYMLSGYIVERIAMAATGEYQWKLLAIHNEILMLITSAISALLVYRLLSRFGTDCGHALVYAAASQAVFLTFPPTLANFWENGAQTAALPFALLFLVFDDISSRHPRGGSFRIARGLSVFFLVWTETIFGVFFLAVFFAFEWLVDRERETLASLFLSIAVPAVVALLLFSAQVSWVGAHYPGPMQGSEFMFRSGLDGSTQYYRDHLDILYGRDVARSNFAANRESLFKWPSLFIAGVIATVIVVVTSSRREDLRGVLKTVVTLTGAYLLYGAMFSQAVVIHPYLYDIFIATPLILALFAFAPAILDSRFRTGGVVALAALLIAMWCAMVQMRHYAMWFPLPPHQARAATGSIESRA